MKARRFIIPAALVPALYLLTGDLPYSLGFLVGVFAVAVSEWYVNGGASNPRQRAAANPNRREDNRPE